MPGDTKTKATGTSQQSVSPAGRGDNASAAEGTAASHPVQATSDINKVNIKAPPFWHDCPNLWFLSLESQFAIARVSSDNVKFHTVVAALDSSVLRQVADCVRNPPEANKYENLGKSLIELFSSSEQEKLRQLFSDFELGDRKPAGLPNKMRQLGGTNINNQMFEKPVDWCRLPSSVQAILQVSNDSLTQKAQLADKIMEVGDYRARQSLAVTSSPYSFYQRSFRTSHPRKTHRQLSFRRQSSDSSFGNSVLSATRGLSRIKIDFRKT